VALSKGLDRDRGVDESGNQVAVFGRWGARPFNRAELERMYLKPDGTLRSVKDTPPGPPREPAVEPKKEEQKEEEPAGPRRPRRGPGSG
jgi:hypothetical protein